MTYRLTLGLIAMVFAVAANAQMYRWVDKQGNVHYTDTPPPPNEVKQIEEKKLRGNVVGGTKGSYAADKAAKDYPITLYTGDCGDACKAAKAYLSQRGAPFTERQPGKNVADFEALKKLTTETFIPTLIVGTTVLKGFTESQWEAALDNAGYPKGGSGPAPATGKKPVY